jgi:hypothetical protein
MERDVAMPFGTLCGYGEHVRADVQTDDRALAPECLKELGDVEARAAAHVKDAVAGSCAERGSHQFASAQHIARRVKRLQPLDEAPIELQLTHVATLSVPFYICGSSRQLSQPTTGSARHRRPGGRNLRLHFVAAWKCWLGKSRPGGEPS